MSVSQYMKQIREPVGTLAHKIKTLPTNKVGKVISKCDLKTLPMEHQARSIYLGLLEKRWLFALDMGLGKTKIVLDILSMRKKFNEVNKTLVITPAVVMKHWQNEVHKHSDLTCSLVLGSAVEKGKAFFHSNTNITIVSSTWITQFLNKYKEALYKELIKLFSSFDCLVIDEAHLFRNAESVGFNMVKKFMMDIPYCYLTSGTPFGNNCIGFYSLYYILDKGETFGANYDKYKNEWFNQLMIKRRYIKYSIKRNKIDIFSKLFWQKMIRFEEKECNDLPPKRYKIYNVELSREQKLLYNKVVTQNKDKRIMDYAFKLMRITGGCVTKENPKLDTLVSIIDELSEYHKPKVVIWCWLVDESKLLFDKLTKEFNKLNIHVIRGETTTKDKNKTLDLWHKGDVDILIANVSSLGVGVDLFESNVCIFYSNNLNVIDRKQAEKRIHRTGQTNKCFIIDILANDTIDILNYGILVNVSRNFNALIRDESHEIKASKIKRI